MTKENILSNLEYNVLVQFRGGPITQLDGPTEMIQHLVDANLLRVTETEYIGDLSIRDIQWELTVEGAIALIQAEERAAQEEQHRAEQEAAKAQHLQERHEDYAREEHYHRSQNRVTIQASTIGAVTGFVLGLIAEHFTGLVSLVSGWFQ